jgi:hypothetical protein
MAVSGAGDNQELPALFSTEAIKNTHIHTLNKFRT